MKHEEFVIKSKDNRILHGQSWAPDEIHNGVICLIHGIGEYIARYTYWAERAVSEDFAFIGIDLCCSGKSEGKRGHMPSFEIFMDDISLLLQKAGLKFPHIPIILYGHSMGGTLVLNYALRRKPEIAGLIVTSSWLKLKNGPSNFLISIVRFASRVFPNLSISSSSSAGPDGISRDKAVVEKYINDPLAHNKISLKMVISLIDAATYALNNAAKLDVPLLLMHGSGDQITDPEGSQQFYESNPEKYTYKLWDGLYHEMHSEPEKEEVFNYLMDWIRKLQ